MTIATVSFEGTQYQLETLGNLSGPELVKLYNSCVRKTGGTETKKFSDKTTALRRTWEALQKASQPTEATIATAPSEQAKKAAEPKPEPAKPAPKAAPKTEKKERQSRGKYFHFKARRVEDQKPVKKDTMRGKLFQLLSREHGATFEQLFNATWGNADARSVAGCDDMDEATQLKTTYEATRLIHYFNGFGLYHDAKDHVHVWSTDDEYKELVKNHPPKHDNGK
jgi:hypothetical protein